MVPGFKNIFLRSGALPLLACASLLGACDLGARSTQRPGQLVARAGLLGSVTSIDAGALDSPAYVTSPARVVPRPARAGPRARAEVCPLPRGADASAPVCAVDEAPLCEPMRRE